MLDKKLLEKREIEFLEELMDEVGDEEILTEVKKPKRRFVIKRPYIAS